MVEMLQRVADGYDRDRGGDAAHGQAVALKRLWSLTWREAQTQTYADAFLTITICFAIATAMVPLMRKVAPARAPTSNAH